VDIIISSDFTGFVPSECIDCFVIILVLLYHLYY